jgi:hypothetical protein
VSFLRSIFQLLLLSLRVPKLKHHIKVMITIMIQTIADIITHPYCCIMRSINSIFFLDDIKCPILGYISAWHSSSVGSGIIELNLVSSEDTITIVVRNLPHDDITQRLNAGRRWGLCSSKKRTKLINSSIMHACMGQPAIIMASYHSHKSIV